MAVPKQVEDAGKVADELLKKQNEPEVPPVEDPESKEKEPEKKPEEKVEKPEVEDFQQKYETLQGKYNAEVVQVGNTNQYLIEEISKLKLANEEKDQLVIDIQKQLNPEPEPKLDLSQFLTKDEMDKLDESGMETDIQEIIAKLSKGVSATNVPQTTNLEKKVGDLEKGQAETRWDRFLNTVYGAVPNLDEINPDPKFVEFMAVRVPGTGASRQAIMDSNTKALDAQSVIEVYKEFLSLTPAIPNPEKKKLEDQVDPVEDLPNAQPAPTTSDKIWKIGEINTHFKEMAIGESSNYARGKYANDPELAKKIDAEIVKANDEGRITR